MSFIAAVIARKGVAIIADSLERPEWPVTRISGPPDRTVFDQADGPGRDHHYVNPWDEMGEGSLLLSPAERLHAEQFHMEDHAEKIFQLDRFTALMMIGIICINDKCMSELIGEFKGSPENKREPILNFPARLDRFCTFLNAQVKVHLAHYKHVGRAALIMAGYNPQTMQTHVCRILIKERSYYFPPWYDTLPINHQPDKIVCFGQHRISESIQRAFQRDGVRSPSYLVKNILKRLGSPDPRLPGRFIQLIQTDPFYRFLLTKDLRTVNLDDLSLQKAIDLASLLMRLEIDYFKVANTTPKVGGVIQLAVIDGNGFQFVR